MTVRVGINGFGRIGRNFFRAVVASGADIEIVGANDLTDNKSWPTCSSTTRSSAGSTPTSRSTDDAIVVGGRRIAALEERDPKALPWGDLGADIVIESTGFFTDATKAQRAHRRGRQEGHHLGAGQERGRHAS